MSGTVTIGGKQVPKWAVYGGTGVVVVGGILYFRHKNGGSSSSSSATDPVTGLPYSMDNQVDPSTGLTYLSEAQQYGSVSAAEAALVGQGTGAAGAAGGGFSGLGFGNPTSDFTGSGTPTGTTYTTNAQWVQAATAGLTSLGYNGSDVGAALGLFLLGMPLDSTQVTIVQTAVAEFGPPPVGQFAIIASPNSQTGSTGSGSGGTTGTGSGSGGGTPVFGSGGPGPEPKPPVSHNPPPAPAWIAEQWVNRTQTNVHWAPSAGATSYQVRVTYQSQEVQTHDTTAQNYTISGLTPDHTYGIHVVAINGNGWSPEASTVVKTKK